MRYHPWHELGQHADIHVEFTDLPSGHGWWVPEERIVLIDRRLNQVERRCVVAHELEHIRRRDVGVTCGVLGARMEARADAAAASRLIPLGRLVDGLLWSNDQSELADELWVTAETLQARLAGLTPIEHDYIDRRLWDAERHIA